METTDWVVIIVCASLGYLIVARLIDKYAVKHSNTGQFEGSQRNTHSQSEGNDRSGYVHQQKDDDNKRWYEILEVDASASLREIRVAYRKKIQQYHPDRLEGMAPELYDLALKRAQVINAAYTEALRLKS